MKRQMRQEKILARLRALQRECRVDELAGAMGVSALTIRRDLERLAREGVVLRTHGGCVHSGRMALDSPYQRRVAENFDLKEAIGREAAGEIRAGEVVLINDGSTCFHLASHMEAGRKVTVYTNSIAMIPELARAGVRVFVIGGEYSRDLCCLGGSLLQNSLETLRFDAAFLGADAVDEKGNCRVNDPETARVTRMMLRCARRSILLADHTKAAAGAHAAYAPVSAFDLWITTRGMPPALLRRFSKMTSVREVAP